MRIAKTISITLPPDLLLKAQDLAQREHRTMSELFREALRTYAAAKPAVDRAAWDEIFAYGHAKGRELGIASEEDVDRILGEHRTAGRG